MNPFDASVRELAAAIAIEAGQLPAARVHVKALTVLEPDRDIHRRRLERVDQLLGDSPPKVQESPAGPTPVSGAEK
jgi:hypothetical protein